MGRKSKGEKKGEFDDLPEEFKAKVRAEKDPTKIRVIIADKAMFGQEMSRMKKEDQHLKECQEAAKEAGAQYAEASKDVKLSIGFCKAELSSRGLPVPEVK